MNKLRDDLRVAPRIWLFQDGEPLPLDNRINLARTGFIANTLAAREWDVTWFTSAFEHGTKKYSKEPDSWFDISPNYRLRLFGGPGYRKNISLRRVIHQHAIAKRFNSFVKTLSPPDMIVAAYPSPELCEAASRYARDHDIPFIVDVRDPWPDSFVEGASFLKRSILLPLVLLYRKKLRQSLKHASAIYSMSRSVLLWASKYRARPLDNRDKVFYLGSPKLDDAGTPKAIPEIFSEAEPLVCIFYGSFGKFHDGEIVISAAKMLAEQGENRIRFIMAGDGDLAPLWKKLAEGLSSVTFTGWVQASAVHKVLQQSHVGLITIRDSFCDIWFGNKFFEYLSAGLALVSNVRAECAQLIEQNALGVNLTENTVEDLVAKLLFLVNNPKEVKRFQENAREIYSKELESSSIYGKYADALQDYVEPAY